MALGISIDSATAAATAGAALGSISILLRVLRGSNADETDIRNRLEDARSQVIRATAVSASVAEEKPGVIDLPLDEIAGSPGPNPPPGIRATETATEALRELTELD